VNGEQAVLDTSSPGEDIVIRKSLGTSLALAALLGGVAEANDLTFSQEAGVIYAPTRDGSAILATGGMGAGLYGVGGGFTAITGQFGRPNTDGTYVAGTVNEEAALWNGGVWTPLGNVPGGSPCGTSISTGYDVSGDGTVVVGLAWKACDAVPFRWTQGVGMEEIPHMGINSARASAVSEDGKVVGGFDEADNGPRRAAIWDESFNETLILVGQPGNAEGLGEVLYLNNDGTAAVGTTLGDPFLWTKSGGVTMIPRPPAGVGSFDSFWATGCTDDASIVVGGSGSFFGSPVAWIWTEWGGTQSIADFLDQYGVSYPNAFDLGACRGIAKDGSMIAGDSGVPFFSQRWVIDLNAPLTESFCVAGTSASGCQATLTFQGVASATKASGFTVTANDVEGGNNAMYYFGSNGRMMMPWGNGTSFQCVAPPTKRSGLLTPVGAAGTCEGTFSLDLNTLWQAIPAKNPGAGATTQCQLWYRDPFNTSNQATSFSDALEFFVCP
jgi:hypothetical protein